MPKRFLTYSRTEPARTILWFVALLTLLAQGITVMPVVAGLAALPNFILVAGVCVWAIWASVKNSVKQMSVSSFWLFMIWLFSAISRMILSPDWTLMLWAPMLIVAGALSVVYLYLSYQRRAVKTEDGIGDLD